MLNDLGFLLQLPRPLLDLAGALFYLRSFLRRFFILRTSMFPRRRLFVPLCFPGRMRRTAPAGTRDSALLRPLRPDARQQRRRRLVAPPLAPRQLRLRRHQLAAVSEGLARAAGDPSAAIRTREGIKRSSG